MSQKLLLDSDDLPNKIDRRYFAQLLLVLEDRLDVNEFKIADVKVWPLIRWILARNIKQPDGIDIRDLASVKPKPKDIKLKNKNPAGLITRIAKKLGIIKLSKKLNSAEQRQLREEVANEALQQQFTKLKNLEPIEFVVMAKVEKYYQTINGKRFSPITDPVFEDLCGYGATLNLALEPFELDCVNEPTILDINPHMLLSAKMPYPGDVKDVQARMDEMNLVLDELDCNFKLDTELVIKRFHRYARKRAYWHEVFSILQPKAVFISSFVGWAPLIWACRDLGITTIDIQHGGQSAFHYHTSHWTKVPKGGYPLLPDFFWVWGETTARNIRPWLPAEAGRHIALVGGNRNLARWIKKENVGELGAAEKVLEQVSSQFGKKILITLGYAQEELLPEFVRNVIKQQPNWFWFIRLHPLKRSATEIKKLEKELIESGVNNFNIEDSTNARLFSVFKMIDHHVTPFSTSGREALALNIPTTIVHPIGKTYFAEDIKEGTFDYADTTELLTNSIDKFKLPEGLDGKMYLATDDGLVDEVVKTVRAFSSSEVEVS